MKKIICLTALLALAFLAAPSAWAVPNHCNQATGGTSVTSRACTFTVSANDIIWVGVLSNVCTTVTSVADTLGGGLTWNAVETSSHGCLYYALTGANSGSDTVTVTISPTHTFWGMFAVEYTPSSDANPIDGHTNDGGNTSGDHATSAITTTRAAQTYWCSLRIPKAEL